MREALLFVCMGNICRSPAAEGVFRKMVADAGRELFTGTRRSADQHPAVGWCQLVDLVAQLIDGGRLADHVLALCRALLELLDLAAQIVRLERAHARADQAPA